MSDCTTCDAKYQPKIIDPVNGIVCCLCANGAGYIYLWAGLAWAEKPFKPLFRRMKGTGEITNCPLHEEPHHD